MNWPRACLALLVLLLGGCGAGRLGDARKALTRDRSEFEAFATQFIQLSADSDLYRFSENEFRCNGVWFRGGWDRPGFEEFAKNCGFSGADLRLAVERFQKLGIYGARVESIGEMKWVEILLDGSEWAPRGFRYVRRDRTSDLMYFRGLQKYRGLHRDVFFEEIGGGWFYFESDC